MTRAGCGLTALPARNKNLFRTPLPFSLRDWHILVAPSLDPTFGRISSGDAYLHWGNLCYSPDVS